MITQFFGILGNIFSSVVLILANKRIVAIDKFKFMTVLTGVHSNFSFVATCILLGLGCLKYKVVNNYVSLLRIAAGAVFSIVFMNFNLAANSVGFYQISKLSCIPVTLFLETLLGRRQQILTLRMMFSLVAIIIGMGLVAINEVSINAVGCLWAACAVCTSSLAQIFFAPLQKELGLNALQMMFHLSPIMTIGSLLTIPMFEDVTALYDFDVKLTLVVDVVVSCFMALASNLTNFLVLGWSSPLTYQVIGHLKTIMILISGIFLYDSIPSGKSIAGMALAMVGVIAYTEENRRQQVKRTSTEQAPAPAQQPQQSGRSKDEGLVTRKPHSHLAPSQSQAQAQAQAQSQALLAHREEEEQQQSGSSTDDKE